MKLDDKRPTFPELVDILADITREDGTQPKLVATHSKAHEPPRAVTITTHRHPGPSPLGTHHVVAISNITGESDDASAQFAQTVSILNTTTESDDASSGNTRSKPVLNTTTESTDMDAREGDEKHVRASGAIDFPRQESDASTDGANAQPISVIGQPKAHRSLASIQITTASIKRHSGHDDSTV